MCISLLKYVDSIGAVWHGRGRWTASPLLLPHRAVAGWYPGIQDRYALLRGIPDRPLPIRVLSPLLPAPIRSGRETGLGQLDGGAAADPPAPCRRNSLVTHILAWP